MHNASKNQQESSPTSYPSKEEKVFGIGLNKTGTTSLGRALEILGYEDHASCSRTLTRHWKAGNWGPIWEVTETHNNFEDWPWPLLYQELFEKYPNSKFILSVRKDAETWYKSLCKHALGTGPANLRKLAYGFHMPQKFKAQHLDFYTSHNESVLRFFKAKAPDRMITVCWEEGDGWEKVCNFLGKEIPEQPFPFLNKAKSHRKNSLVRTFFNRIRIFFLDLRDNLEYQSRK